MAIASKAVTTLVAPGTSNAAAATVRGTVDLRTALGGILTLKIINGSTGPTTQAQANILVAHNTGSTPASASAGTDWKTIWSVGGGVASNGVMEQSWTFGPEVMHLEVEFTGNTGQAVTVEAVVSVVSNIS